MPPQLIPWWVRRANRRRTLLGLGVSLTEQAAYPARELDELLRVNTVILLDQQRRTDEANRT